MSTRSCKLAALGALALLLAGAAPRPAAARPEPLAQVQAGVAWDDNVSRAISRADIVGDSALELGASLGLRAAPGDRSTLAVSADLRGTRHRRFRGLDRVSFGAGASLRSKFGLGAYAPWASVSASVAREAVELGLRDGRRAALALVAGRRLSTRFELSGGLLLERFDAADARSAIPGVSGDAFSTRAHGAFAHADFEASARWLVGAEVSERTGDVVASTRRDRKIFEYSSAVIPDPAFGPDYVAYRLEGRTQTLEAFASYALGERTALNFGVARALTRATGNFNYGSTRSYANIFWSY